MPLWVSRMLSAALALICVSGLRAQSAATPVLSPLPTNGFQFTGAWTCTGQFRAGKLHRAEVQGAIVLGGRWLELSEQDVEPTTGYTARYLIGFDAQAHQLVEFDANNFGAATYSSVQGWQDQTLTMTSAVNGDASAPYALNRFIYTVDKDKGVFTVDWQISKTAAANWVQGDHLTCSRAAQTQGTQEG